MSGEGPYPCKQCGRPVDVDDAGSSFVSIVPRVLSLDEIFAGVEMPASITYAYCADHNVYKDVPR